MTLDDIAKVLKREQDIKAVKSAIMTLYAAPNMTIEFPVDPDTGDLTGIIFTDTNGNTWSFTAEEYVAYIEANPDTEPVFMAGVPTPARIKIWYDPTQNIWYAKLNQGLAVNITGLI